jgi:hypothetical protein
MAGSRWVRAVGWFEAAAGKEGGQEGNPHTCLGQQLLAVHAACPRCLHSFDSLLFIPSRPAPADVDAQFKEDAAASVLRYWAGKAANELDHKLALGRLLAGGLWGNAGLKLWEGVSIACLLPGPGSPKATSDGQTVWAGAAIVSSPLCCRYRCHPCCRPCCSAGTDLQTVEPLRVMGLLKRRQASAAGTRASTAAQVTELAGRCLVN